MSQQTDRHYAMAAILGPFVLLAAQKLMIVGMVLYVYAW